MSEHSTNVDQHTMTAQDYEELGRAIVDHARQRLQSGAVQSRDVSDGLREFEVGPLTVRVRQSPQSPSPSPDARSSGGECCVCVVDTGGVIVCRGWCCPGQPGF